MTKMTIEELRKDKQKIEQLMSQTQIQLWRYQGALSYILDNIKKEEEDDRKGTD